MKLVTAKFNMVDIYPCLHNQVPSRVTKIDFWSNLKLRNARASVFNISYINYVCIFSKIFNRFKK